MTRPRVMHVIAGLDPGGAESMLLYLVEGMHHWEHTVVSLKEPGSVASALQGAGAEVVSLKMRAGRPSLGGMASLAQLAWRRRPHVVQGWMYHGNLAALAAGRVLVPRPKIYWSIHNAAPQLQESPLHTRLTARSNGLLSSAVDAVIYVARSSRQAHEARGFAPGRCVVIPGGVDTERFVPDASAGAVLRRRLQLPETARLVGIVARHDPLKDHTNFIQAAALIQAPDVHFLVAGAGLGAAPAELQQWVTPFLQPRLHWLGPQSDVVGLLQGLDVCTLSSVSEALPMVVLEALACGTLTVTTQVGDCADVLGRAGWVVPCRSPMALAQAWEAALGCQAVEAETRRALGRAQVLQRYSRQRLVERFVALYEDE